MRYVPRAASSWNLLCSFSVEEQKLGLRFGGCRLDWEVKTMGLGKERTKVCTRGTAIVASFCFLFKHKFSFLTFYLRRE